MSQPSTIPQQLMTCSLLHFEQGVPIDDLDLRTEHRARLARVEHVYWIWMKNPFIDVFPMFKQIIKGKYANPQSEWLAAKKDKILFDFVVEHVSPPSRKVSEQKVRVSADHLMKIGMETDNGYNIEAGAKLLMKLDRLDQPESEKMDMAKAAFLPPVVTVSAHEVDDTKEDMSDRQALAIMNKYDAYVDEKRKMIEDKVSLMEAKDVSNEQDRD